MRDNAGPADVYPVIEEVSQLVGVSCSPDTVLPILSAYGDTLAQAVVAFRVATSERNAGDLDCRFTMLPPGLDPYAVAVSNGLIEATDHPVGSLLGELHRGFPIGFSGIDFGVVGGFKKTWSFFPLDDLQPLSELAELESMPASAAGNLPFFTRYGLADRVSLVGIDYRSRSVNLYFGAPPAEVFTPHSLTSILKEAGLPGPSERLLRFATRAFGIYATLTWDSPKVERITIAAMTADPLTLPVPVEPAIEDFLKNAPYSTDGHQFVYAITSAPSGEYHKLQSYYRWRSQVETTLLVPDSE
ncbi:aromatic prenyltransferase [Streptomyces sp. NBC_00243]|uniref:aromatic prenyltransferase n=1 Tax=Streptomyces sp. NBC_00243 TaxID=2975688 RepID=UPI002DD7A1A8|nr:aromatic prenyltransferase [Streptomyces sp. NBC_00243]WRZ17073.1 aromatic prenyltransferase [Streptomyces sp. NBC_00243]WRZ25591.1 aromatic prenyltransferase [Streptomyces sp. NBC_00243]